MTDAVPDGMTRPAPTPSMIMPGSVLMYVEVSVAPDRAGERRQAGQECPLAAEAVRGAAGHQQQPGEHHHVGVDDPLQLACGRVQVADQGGQHDVEHRVVQRHDEQ
jgi:hypothetical protein